MRRINLEEIRHDGKESRKFAYLHGDAENPRPRIHQLEHFADHIAGSNRLEAVVVSLGKFEEIRSEYKKVLAKEGELTKERRQDIEELAYEEEFVPTKKGMLLFYHPQANELRAREVHPPDVG
jgi:Fe-S oxidoreductase